MRWRTTNNIKIGVSLTTFWLLLQCLFYTGFLFIRNTILKKFKTQKKKSGKGTGQPKM